MRNGKIKRETRKVNKIELEKLHFICIYILPKKVLTSSNMLFSVLIIFHWFFIQIKSHRSIYTCDKTCVFIIRSVKKWQKHYNFTKFWNLEFHFRNPKYHISNQIYAKLANLKMYIHLAKKFDNNIQIFSPYTISGMCHLSVRNQLVDFKSMLQNWILWDGIIKVLIFLHNTTTNKGKSEFYLNGFCLQSKRIFNSIFNEICEAC